MNVAAVQKHFRDLADFLAAAELTNAKSAENLRAVAAACEPFTTFSVAEFAQFLFLAQQSEEYLQTGKIPVPAVPKRTNRTPRPPKPSKPLAPSPDELIQRIVTLWNNATRRDISEQDFEATLQLVDQLKGEKLQELADIVHVGAKKYPNVQKKKDEIKYTIRERRDMPKRSQI